MPVLHDMEFAAGGLLVAYRASAQPQELTIEVVTAGTAEFPMSVASLRAVIEAVNRGAAGGAVFDPLLGAAERLDGPWDGEGVLGPAYRWTLRVAGVAPLFLRNVVEELRRAGADRPVTRMSLVGTLPLDGSEMSVREGLVRSWLDDRATYLEAWPHREFPVDVEPTDHVANLRIELATSITPEIRSELEATSVWWLNAIRNYVSEEGFEVVMNPSKTLPAFGSSRTEFRAHYAEFLYKRAPARAALQNLLYRFHRSVAPIARVALQL
ncbi:hypothetical protein [Sorangium sp. So ce1153]|uniref:hypothetical protein n=1 Tax=Sorangium sp. So ce1153 TaxID=3133333 RepID=UPI003F629858